MKPNQILAIIWLLVGITLLGNSGCEEGKNDKVSNPASESQAVTLTSDVNSTGTQSSGDETEFSAYSLKVAEERIKSERWGWQDRNQDIFKLSGITQFYGLVWDESSDDIILIGRRIEGRPELTLDDFVVVLRAIFNEHEYPGVSIDPTPDTPRTNMQNVRYDGGIENTAVGMNLFDADLRLKKIGQGSLESGLQDFSSHWDMALDDALAEYNAEFEEFIAQDSESAPGSASGIMARFWFRPTEAIPIVKDNVIALGPFDIGVFTEVLGVTENGRPVTDLAGYIDPIGNSFALEISRRINELYEVQESMARLRGLLELTGIAIGFGQMGYRPYVSYWLNEFQVTQIDTPERQEVLKREYTDELEHQENRSDGSTTWSMSVSFEMSGGVSFEVTPVVLDLGDVGLLNNSVLEARPDENSLSWAFRATDWSIPVEPDSSSDPESLSTIFDHAVFLQNNQRPEDAISIYGRLLGLSSSCPECYFNRGLANLDLKNYQNAAEDFTSTINLDPQQPNIFHYRGESLTRLRRFDEAVDDFDTALEQSTTEDTNRSEIYFDRGVANYYRTEYEETIEDCTSAIELEPDWADPYNLRGLSYEHIGAEDRALEDFNTVMLLDPDFGDVGRMPDWLLISLLRKYGLA